MNEGACDAIFNTNCAKGLRYDFGNDTNYDYALQSAYFFIYVTLISYTMLECISETYHIVWNDNKELM